MAQCLACLPDAIADINKDFVHLVHKIKQPSAFPTIIYLSGDKIENYEDSAINDKRREVDCFMNWIESHVSKIEVVSDYKDIPKRRSSKKRKSSHKRRITGGKSHIIGGRKSTRRRGH